MTHPRMNAQELLRRATRKAERDDLRAQVTPTPVGFHLELGEANPVNPNQPRRGGIALNDGDHQGSDEQFDAYLAALIASAVADIKKPPFLRPRTKK